MTDSSGNLSVDFLVGFTIFMVAFIWVATLVPNLLIGVSAHGVDFDAVAYRTCVILAEDPGASAQEDIPWEAQKDTAKDNILRFGLAISKQTPNILSETKVERFFNSSDKTPAGPFVYPEDYQRKAIFGDYPYHFNISLKMVDESRPTLYIGEIPPGNYGFMRREVKIKHTSNATIDKTDFATFNLNNTGIDGNVTYHNFAIIINTTELDGNVSDPLMNPISREAYSINPRNEWINITIEDLAKKPRPIPNWVVSPLDADINLSKITFWQTDRETGKLNSFVPGAVTPEKFTYLNANPNPVSMPIENLQNEDNITLAFPPGFFTRAEDGESIYVNLTFGTMTDLPPGSNAWQGMQYLNTSRSGPWSYSYNATQVTQPSLTDAVLEVAIW